MEIKGGRGLECRFDATHVKRGILLMCGVGCFE